MESLHFPIPISIGTVSDNSGIYVSRQNVVFGISSHSKSNNGLGSIGSQNILCGNTNIVYDSDVIDTPIDDRDVNIYQHIETSSTPPITHVGFDSINVATLAQNSGIYVGDVKVTGLDAHSKQNFAKGTVYGNGNVEMRNINVNFDPDMMDTPIYDQDVKILTTSKK